MNETRKCPNCGREISVYAPLATQWDHAAGRCVAPVTDGWSFAALVKREIAKVQGRESW